MTEKLYDVTALGEILIDFTEWAFPTMGRGFLPKIPAVRWPM